MLTDVSQHRLRQGQIPAEWSDRVRTQTSSLETNSIQAEVMWPGLRPSAQLRYSWVGLLSAYLSNYQSVLMLKSALGSAEVLSAVSDCQHRSQSHRHAWNWPAVSVIYWHNPSWEDLHKGGNLMYFLPLPSKCPSCFTVRNTIIEQWLPAIYRYTSILYILPPQFYLINRSTLHKAGSTS